MTMKTLTRTAIILVAAFVVIGALFAFAQTSLAASWFGAAAGASQHANEGGGAGVPSLMPVLKNAGIMSAVILVVVVAGLIPQLGRRRKPARSR
jgi:hypothetical protein